MKKTVLAATASVVTALGFAGFAWYSSNLSRLDASPLKASLAVGASLDDAPVPLALPSYDLSAHQTLSRVILLIRENYVDPERVKPYDMFLAALDYVQKTIPEVMVDDTEAPKRISVSVGTTQQLFELGDLDQLWEVTMALRDIFRFLQTEISNSALRRDIEYAAINGMLSTLDPHSVLLKPESFDEVKLSTKGEFGGLGIVISIRDGLLTVISPIAGTPASRVGLKAKDRIVKIGEESTVNMTLEEAVQRLRGKPNTKVSVWVLRKNWTEPRKYELTRAIIKIESVTSELLDDGVGYVRIKSFQNNTYDDLRTHLERLRRKNGKELTGLVLDLRNNPGGLLDQAILVSDRFVDRGALVITVGEGNRKREVKPAHFTGTETGYPIAVLVNGGSASASEIVSGALKNHNRAVIIGQRTFGKGSVQVLYDFKDKSALKLTIAQYLTPGDISIQSVGIQPDVEVVPATISKESIHLFVDNDSPREKDLDKHLEQHGSNQGQRTSKALLHIVNLLPENENDGQADKEEADQEEFRVDFEIGLARQMLAGTKGTGRDDILRSAKPVLQAREHEEQAAIAARLKSIGVDWSPGPGATQPPNVQLSLDCSATAGAKRAARRVPNHFVAGQTLLMTATATNRGNEPLHQVYAVADSENPLLKNREFAFGKLMPGQSRKWSVKVKLPKDMSPRADSVSLRLGDQHKITQNFETSTVVTIDELPKPRFSYVYFVDDRAKGNGDGVLQVGEAASLKVRVENVGEGSAEDTLVTLKNLEGRALFLNRGRAKIGKLAPGQSQTGVLEFSLRKALEGDEAEDGVDMRVGIWDGEIGVAVSENLQIPVEGPRKGKAERRAVRIGGATEHVAVYAGAAAKSPVLGRVSQGTLLKTDMSFDGGQWYRIQVAGGLVGYLRGGDVDAVQKSRRGAQAEAKMRLNHAAPVVELSYDSLVTHAEAIQLKGIIRDDRALRDMYVFVNDKKVHYRSLGDAKAVPHGVEASIDLRLPLKKGANAIVVVARENDEVTTRRQIGVFRTSSGAVAERVTVPASSPKPH